MCIRDRYYHNHKNGGAETPSMSSAESEALASGILKALGGKNNIVKVDYCATRLRFEVHSYASVDEAAAKAASEPAPAASKPQPKKVARPKPVDSKPSRDEMTFAQRMVTSKEPVDEDDIPGMPPAQKLIIALALIGFIVFMGYTITGSMGLH